MLMVESLMSNSIFGFFFVIRCYQDSMNSSILSDFIVGCLLSQTLATLDDLNSFNACGICYYGYFNLEINL